MWQDTRQAYNEKDTHEAPLVWPPSVNASLRALPRCLSLHLTSHFQGGLIPSRALNIPRLYQEWSRPILVANAALVTAGATRWRLVLLPRTTRVYTGNWTASSSRKVSGLETGRKLTEFYYSLNMDDKVVLPLTWEVFGVVCCCEVGTKFGTSLRIVLADEVL